MNKKHDIYGKQVKAAQRRGDRVQQEKVKDHAKATAAREASKAKGKGKVDDDAPMRRHQGSGEIIAWTSTSQSQLS